MTIVKVIEDLSSQPETELRENLRALRLLSRITGSTPELTELLRKGRRQAIVEIEAELARRNVSAAGIDLSGLSKHMLLKLRAIWQREYERWGSVDKPVANAIAAIDAELKRRDE